MKKLGLLIILAMMSFTSFSQTDTDTLSIQLEKPVVKLVIKDLLTGDEAKEELVLSSKKFKLLEQKVELKDSIILNLNNKISNITMDEVAQMQKAKAEYVDKYTKDLEVAEAFDKQSQVKLDTLGVNNE